MALITAVFRHKKIENFIRKIYIDDNFFNERPDSNAIPQKSHKPKFRIK